MVQNLHPLKIDFSKMELKEEVQRRLTKLIKLINRSEKIETEIKDLFQNITTANLDSEGASGDKGKIVNIYQGRYNLLLKKGIQSKSYAAVLRELAIIDDRSEVYLTPFNIKNKLYLVFSDPNYEVLFGMIFKDW